MYVYGYENTINGKWYIGKSVDDGDKRQQEHRRGAKGDTQLQFYKAVRKYGWDAFNYVVLERCDNEALLAELEISYILQKDSYKKGYNATPGGNGGNTWSKLSEERKKIANEKRSNTLIKDWENNRTNRLKNFDARDFSFRKTKKYREEQSKAHIKEYILLSPSGDKHTFNGVVQIKEYFKELNSNLPLSSCKRVSPTNLIWRGNSKGWICLSRTSDS